MISWIKINNIKDNFDIIIQYIEKKDTGFIIICDLDDLLLSYNTLNLDQ